VGHEEARLLAYLLSLEGERFWHEVLAALEYLRALGVPYQYAAYEPLHLAVEKRIKGRDASVFTPAACAVLVRIRPVLMLRPVLRPRADGRKRYWVGAER
jgi:hypothetical protein